MKKLGAAAVMAAMTIVVAALCGVALADDGHAKPDKPAPPPKAAKAPDVKQQESKPESAPKPSEPEAKVYICHATGSDKNPYVLIHVSSHALPAHTGHQDGRDIVLGASPGACPGATSTAPSAQVSGDVKQLVSFCDMETATTGKFETKDAKEVVKHELDGQPEEARDIVPTFTYNGQTYSQNFDTNGQAIVAAQCNEATEAGVQGTEATSCTDTDNDQGDIDKAKQHDDNGKGDDKNGVDRDQKAKDDKAKHEDNDDDDNCPAAASTPPSSSNTFNASNVSSSNTASSNTASSNTASSSNSASTSSNTASTSSNTASTSSNTASTSSVGSSPMGENSNNANAGVLGAVKALSAPASAPVLSAKPHANAGVLGTVAKLSSAATSGTLPFSGIRLWIFELVALGLIGLGVATRLVVRRRPN